MLNKLFKIIKELDSIDTRVLTAITVTRDGGNHGIRAIWHDGV
jgi:hypothetical protein